MHRSVCVLLLSALIVASCATTPSPSPGLSEATRSSSASAITSPNATPTPTSPPTAGGWPYIGDIGALVFGPDGTVYLLAGTRDAQGEDQQTLVALDAAGHVKPGWPIEEPAGSDFGALAIGPDGSVYVEACGGPAVGCVLHRLDATGRELPGWPFEAPPCVAGSPCFFDLEVGPDGTAYLWEQPAGWELIAIDASGKIKPGWPLALEWEEPEGSGGLWLDVQVGADGTVFIHGGASLLAFAPDGRSRTGWPVAVPDIGGFLLGPLGTVIVWSWIDNTGELCFEPRRTVFTVLGPDGRTLPGWPRGSMGLASSPVVAADGTVYYISAGYNLYAHDWAGEIKGGWPVAVPAAISHLCGPESPALAPDGTIYVLAHDYRPNNIEITARSPDGRSRPGWPYRSSGELIGPPYDSEGGGTHSGPVFGPDGTVYLVVFQTDATGVRAEVVAVDRQGQLKAGWPYRLSIDPTAGEVASLAVSPDGRLFVRSENDSSQFLLALEPDGRLSD